MFCLLLVVGAFMVWTVEREDVRDLMAIEQQFDGKRRVGVETFRKC